MKLLSIHAMNSRISEGKQMKRTYSQWPVLTSMVSSVVLLGTVGIANATDFDSSHAFSISDLQGTYAPDQSKVVTIGKGKDGSQTATMYPVDSIFGFKVEDFVGAAEKTIDGAYTEGWIGNVAGGVAVADAPTDTFKVPPLMGTWCAGLGGNAVKCSSEHYVVMESVKTCYESVLTTGVGSTQPSLLDPATGAVVGSCEDEKLDDDLYIVRNDAVSTELLASVAPGDQMASNESTVRDDVAISNDYAVTLKDDGKPLYRWGNLVKRPNDVRLYARLALPAEWKAVTNYRVTKAVLEIDHLITNNPNDQVRPEDMENEGATGRQPSYSNVGGTWTSVQECYAGDGSLIPSGSLLKDPSQAKSGAFSDDLAEGFTHFWYTTTDRDPFEWSYTGGSDARPNDALGTLVSGPRWRLKANKFGQDIPGLEIPKMNCAQPPFESGSLKYETGDRVTTYLNLLDWKAGTDGLVASPLVNSRAWVDASQNPINSTLAGGSTGENGESINHLPLTDDFDLAIYVKGDQKPTIIYSAKLVLSYELPTPQ